MRLILKKKILDLHQNASLLHHEVPPDHNRGFLLMCSKSVEEGKGVDGGMHKSQKHFFFNDLFYIISIKLG